MARVVAVQLGLLDNRPLIWIEDGVDLFPAHPSCVLQDDEVNAGRDMVYRSGYAHGYADAMYGIAPEL